MSEKGTTETETVPEVAEGTGMTVEVVKTMDRANGLFVRGSDPSKVSLNRKTVMFRALIENGVPTAEAAVEVGWSEDHGYKVARELRSRSLKSGEFVDLAAEGVMKVLRQEPTVFTREVQTSKGEKITLKQERPVADSQLLRAAAMVFDRVEPVVKHVEQHHSGAIGLVDLSKFALPRASHDGTRALTPSPGTSINAPDANGTARVLPGEVLDVEIVRDDDADGPPVDFFAEPDF